MTGRPIGRLAAAIFQLELVKMNDDNRESSHMTLAEGRAVDAEQRVNLVRILAIAAFYLIHLWHASAPKSGAFVSDLIGVGAEPAVTTNIHVAITTLCLGWLMQAFVVHFYIFQRRIPVWLPMASTLGDIFWLTAVLGVSTGPRGPMVVGYFLILMLAGLRFNLRLVRISTIAAAAGYVILLGMAKWPVGLLKQTAAETVPRYHQFMVVLAIVFAGIIVGQMVRHGYAISDEIASRRQERTS